MRTGTETDPRPRGRPRQFDEDSVLRIVLERFRVQGYAATSLDDLAEATGVNRPSLYAAFGGKKALYLAALARAHTAVAASLDRLIAANLPMPEMLQSLFAGAITTYLAGEGGPAGCIVINTAATEAATDPDIRAALADILAMEDARIETAFRQAGSPNPPAHARIAASMLHSLSVRARAGEPRAALIAIAKDMSALLAG